MEIKHLIENLNEATGVFETNTGELVCVSSHKYREVELCFKESWNLPFATIKLYSRDLFQDADQVFKDAKILGMEIARRWNEAKALEEKNKSLLSVAICLGDDLECIRQICRAEGWALTVGDRSLNELKAIK